MKCFFARAACVALLIAPIAALATSYPLPPANESLIGKITTQSAGSEETVLSIAQKYDLGYNAIENANPTLDMTKQFSPGTTIQIPTKHLLPGNEREGIVVNLPEMRMYYYPANSNEVLTYPIGIGRIGKMIPITKTTITYKRENPTWTPPQDIRDFNLEKGIILPRVMPAGPDNPLGKYAIYMKIPTYLMHSTPYVESIGTRASFGCIRMYSTDIENFFPSITKGIPVEIINKPIKLGWEDHQLMMESHPPLEEHGDASDTSLPGVVQMISNETDETTLVDWQMVSYLMKERDGIPHDIGIKITRAD